MIIRISIVAITIAFGGCISIASNNISITETSESETDGGAEASPPGCLFGSADCDHDMSNLCEVNLLADSANCGSCGVFCGDARVIAECKNGMCIQIGCKMPFTICGEGIGCPTNLYKDWNNCGSCGVRCEIDAGAYCDAGACTPIVAP